MKYSNVHIDGCHDTTTSLYINKLLALLNKTLEGKLYIDNGEAIISRNFADVQSILTEQKEVGKNFLIRNALIETIFNVNKKTSHGGFYASIFFASFMKDMLKNKTMHTHVEYPVSTYIEHICRLTKLSDRDVLDVALKTHIPNHRIKNILIEAITLAGFDGQIYINDKSKDNVCIELIMGNKFNIGPHTSFISSGRVKKWERNDVACLIVDGLVEKVSELDRVLVSISKTKQPTVIFARGFSEDVVATLLANFMKETLDIIPVIVPYDLRGVNTLKDIAVCLKSDVVSSLKGELISSIDIDNCPTAECIAINHKYLVIKNPSAKENIMKNIRYLTRMLDASHQPEKQKLINERLASMGTRCVTISLDDVNKSHLYFKNNEIKQGIKLINEIAQSGYLDITLLVPTNMYRDSYPLRNVVDTLISNDIRHVPAPSFIHGLLDGYSLAHTLRNTNVFITSDS